MYPAFDPHPAFLASHSCTFGLFIQLLSQRRLQLKNLIQAVLFILLKSIIRRRVKPSNS